MFTFNLKYFLATLLLFIIEVLIALFAHDEIIRPYVGDILVAVMVYCFVKTLLNTPVIATAVSVLIFCYLVEISQYFHLVVRLGLADSRVANIVLGNYFSWVDMGCYTLGIAITLIVEKISLKHPF